MSNGSKLTLAGIRGKVALLLGGSLAAMGANASIASQQPFRALDSQNQPSGSRNSRPLAAKLILKQQKVGFKMVASHESHTSHGSHGSHGSHSSHSSGSY